MLQGHVTPLPLALVASVQLACMLASIAVLRTKAPHVQGWRIVGPSSMHWFAFLGCWALSALIGWVWLFVGSSRSDAELQMQYALGLSLAFGAGAAWSGFYIRKLRRIALRWRGTAIHWRERGRDVIEDVANFDAFRRALSGTLLFRFQDGTILKLDPYAQNAEALMAAISERTGREVE